MEKEIIKPDLTLSGGSQPEENIAWEKREKGHQGKREVLSVRSSENGFCSLVAELTVQV